MASITDRIDNVTCIPPQYLKAVVPAPKSVKIEISPRCNYRCGFCALRTREVQPKWDMDFGLFKRMTRRPFMEAWNSAPFVALRAAHLKKDVRGTVCENCIAY